MRGDTYIIKSGDICHRSLSKTITKMRCVLFVLAFGVCLSYTNAFSNSCSVRNTTRNVSNYSVMTDIIYDPALNECECDLCVRKCCDANYILYYGDICVYNNLTELKVPVFKYHTLMTDKRLDSTGFIYGWMKCSLDNETYLTLFADDAYVQEDGTLWLWKMDKYLDYEHYCLDYNQDMKIVTLICMNITEFHSFYSCGIIGDLAALGQLISLPFLLATLTIYAILPLKNFYGKSLMCYVFSVFMATLLEMLNDEGTCTFMGIAVVYFNIAPFFWMNVMCINIWLRFSGTRAFQRFRRQSNRKRFLIYFAYAWGVPLVCIILILGISQVAEPNTWYNPGFSGTQCAISEGTPGFLYYDLPRVPVVIVNIILFVATACNIKKMQKDTSILTENGNRISKYTSDKRKYKVYLKLFVIMGINTAVEIIIWIISWQVKNAPITIICIPALFNAAFGVFIFFIFVFKKSIWRLLRKRCCKKKKKPAINNVRSTTTTSSMTTPPTSTAAGTNC